MIQVVEHLPNMCKVLSSISGTAENKQQQQQQNRWGSKG
jgi:hypothetical protein